MPKPFHHISSSTNVRNYLTTSYPNKPVQSVQVTFTTRRINCPQVNINDIKIPVQTETKYLVLHLDQKLAWQKHVRTKRQQLNLRLRKMFWLLGPKSKLSVKNKQTHHKTHMDIPYTAMWLHKTIKQQNNWKSPVQSPTLNSQRTMVCLQPYSP
jgi:hypothetical protein